MCTAEVSDAHDEALTSDGPGDPHNPVRPLSPATPIPSVQEGALTGACSCRLHLALVWKPPPSCSRGSLSGRGGRMEQTADGRPWREPVPWPSRCPQSPPATHPGLDPPGMEPTPEPPAPLPTLGGAPH